MVLGAKRTIKIAAIDSSGFESRHVSHYFLQRKESRGHPERAVFARFHPKLTLLCDCKTHLILAFLTGKGPSPDNKKLKPTLRNCSPDLVINKLLADAGFDGEPNHVFARDKLGIKTFVPPIIGRPSTKPLNGKCRDSLLTQSGFLMVNAGRWKLSLACSNADSPPPQELETPGPENASSLSWFSLLTSPS